MTDVPKPAVETIHRRPSDQQGEGSLLNWLAVFIAVGIVLLWLLFELQRMPYRPPVDMSTFLGAPELIAVRSSLMPMVALVEVLLVTGFLVKLSRKGSQRATVIGRAFQMIATVVGGLLLTAIVGHLFYENIELEMRLEDADEETHHFEVIPGQAEAADPEQGVKYLGEVLADEGARFERLRGSPLDRIVERARSKAEVEIIAILRNKTGKDFGHDPKHWIDGLSGSPK